MSGSATGRLDDGLLRALAADPDSPCPHRFGDVLQGLRAEIVEDGADLAADLPVRVVGDADAAGLGELFETGSDVDAVAENIVLVDHDVAEVNADAEFDPRILRHGGVLPGHAALDFDRALRRIDGAGKLDQHLAADGFHDAAAMRGDGGTDQCAPGVLQIGKRPLIVQAHQTVVVGDIRRHYRRQPSFQALAGQTTSTFERSVRLHQSMTR